MNIRKTINVCLVSLVVVLFSGCATTTHNANVNQVDDDTRKAILILAKKVERLERMNGIGGHVYAEKKQNIHPGNIIKQAPNKAADLLKSPKGMLPCLEGKLNIVSKLL